MSDTTMTKQAASWDIAVSPGSNVVVHTGKKYVDRDIKITTPATSLSGNNCTLGDTNVSGVSVTADGNLTKYISKVILTNGKKIQIDDGIYVWTFEKDASGNVMVY